MSLFERIDAARERWDVLRHPFYRRWSAGQLSTEQLAFYAAEYRHAVLALAEASARAARAAGPEARKMLEGHAAEERAHVELWRAFADELGADTGREPLPETAACAATWTAGEGVVESLVTLYAVESSQPAVSQTKLEGLLTHYGFEPGRATEYFSLHAVRDHEHAAQSRHRL